MLDEDGGGLYRYETRGQKLLKIEPSLFGMPAENEAGEVVVSFGGFVP